MNILDAALSAEWAMEETAIARVLEIAARQHEVTPQALEAYRAKSLEKAERARVRDGVAILDASGPMFKGANLMTEMSGATSYQTLRRDFQAALDDGNVKAILLNVDTPGGEARGIGELAQAIAEARGTKPVVAYAADLAASAGYWLASAADRIMIGRGAALGSIGVRAAYGDTSARDEARGIKTIEFVSSQSPYKAADLTSKDGKSRIQARVDAMAQVFIDTVAANRGVSVAQVLDGFGKGDVLIGQAAIDAGMADGLGTFESVLAALIRETDPLASGGFFPARASLSQTQEMAAMPKEIEEQAKAEALKPEANADENAGSETASTETPIETASTEAEIETASETVEASPAVVAERDRVSALFAVCPAGFESARDEAIKTGSSASTFTALIESVKKAQASLHAQAIDDDTRENAIVAPSSDQERASGDEAAVQAILGSFKLATGEK